ncbi:MAG: hypothetical protein ACTHLZ_17195 [Tepidisphaeraceae bacterium]
MVSLFVGASVLALWFRSYICTDEFTYRGPAIAFRIRSDMGWCYFIKSRYLLYLYRWGFILDARTRGGMLIDMPDVMLRIPHFSFVVWSAILPAWRFLLPAVRRRRLTCGFDGSQLASTPPAAVGRPRG